jgi:predicted nucleic acid-binding protein
MKDAVVVDASIALKWVLDEPDSDRAQILLAEWIDKGLVILAPALLAYEATNSLYRIARKGEITRDRARQALTKILFTGLELDFSQDASLSMKAMELSERFDRPATYDSHYLALAEREGCEFWTADTRLWNSIRGKFSWARWMGDYQPTDRPTSPNEPDNS